MGEGSRGDWIGVGGEPRYCRGPSIAGVEGGVSFVGVQGIGEACMLDVGSGHGAAHRDDVDWCEGGGVLGVGSGQSIVWFRFGGGHSGVRF